MSKHQGLSDALKSVYADKKTGHIFFIGKRRQGTKLGTIVVREGTILSMEFSGKKNDEALPLLLASEIAQVRFAAVPVPESDRSTSLISTTSVLEQIENNAAQTHQSDTPIVQDIDLKSEALKLLEGLFGATASQKINKIAAKYPPSEQPLEFLDDCKKIIATTFGKAMAEQTLTNLRRRLK